MIVWITIIVVRGAKIMISFEMPLCFVVNFLLKLFFYKPVSFSKLLLKRLYVIVFRVHYIHRVNPQSILLNKNSRLHMMRDGCSYFQKADERLFIIYKGEVRIGIGFLGHVNGHGAFAAIG